MSKRIGKKSETKASPSTRTIPGSLSAIVASAAITRVHKLLRLIVQSTALPEVGDASPSVSCIAIRARGRAIPDEAMCARRSSFASSEMVTGGILSRALAQEDVGRSLARDVLRAFIAQGAHVDVVQALL